MEAYRSALAEVNFAEKFLVQFDPTNIEARIKDLRKQIIQEESRG